jgi:malate synthase
MSGVLAPEQRIHDPRVPGTLHPRFEEILTRPAIDFLWHLHRAFAPRREQELARREATAARIAAGEPLGFDPETAAVRHDPRWRVAGAGRGLEDRRVEITGPPTRRMTVNALNSGAKVWMADFEDATAPTWENAIGGQLNLLDAVLGRLDFTTPEGKRYRVGEDPATIVVRPRGWHLVERGLRFDGRPASASLVDFGLYLFHCGELQLARGEGPYFYLPKLESRHEAALWNDVFAWAEGHLRLPQGTIRATVLIETLPAAFQMEEILYELRDHAAGLNAGRWDYIFSAIKLLGDREGHVLPDRADVTMTVPFMRAYTELLVSTCHRRGAYAIGGMAAFIPGRTPEVTERALAKVAEDKRREAEDGFDGSWVAHPGLVDACRAEFDAVLGERPHQLDRLRDDVDVTAEQLLDLGATPGAVTRAGVENNAAVAVRYVSAWLGGAGAVAIFDLMEDAATAEIARAQLWQWARHRVRLDDGAKVTTDLVVAAIDAAERDLREERDAAEHERIAAAAALVRELISAERPAPFFTAAAYERLTGACR